MAGRQSGRGRKRQGDGWEEHGGYMAAKMQKLHDQYQKDGSQERNAAIFKGVAIYVNGYTKPSSDELKKLVTTRGGRYEHYLYKTRVTHIVASNLPYSKIRDLKHCKVVRPEWITDSVKEGKLLSYIPYQLYTDKGGLQQGIQNFGTSVTSSSTSVGRHIENIFENASESSPFENGNSFLNSQENGTEVSGRHYSDMQVSLQVKKHEESLKFATNVPDDDDDFFSEHADTFSTEQNDFENVRLIEKTGLNNTVEQTLLNAREQSSNHLQDPKSMAKAGDPAFLSEFYSNSRLHHLSTWKSELKQYVSTLQSNSSEFPGAQNLLRLVRDRELEVSERTSPAVCRQNGKPERVVMHVDMDCFFVSVGLRKHTNLKGKPVAVTHSKGKGQLSPTPGSDLQYEREQWALKREQGGKKGKSSHINKSSEQYVEFDEELGHDVFTEKQPLNTFHSMAEIASCSYEARQAGVKNGMFMGKAKQLCPELQTIPYDFEGYQEVSKILYDVVASYTHDIEAVSCDEMLVDCTDLLSKTGAGPLEFATMLRNEIFEKTSCTASVGLGPNILLARMATRKAKPNGQYYLEKHNAEEFLKEQSIKNLPGIGWSMSRKLRQINVETCGDLQKVPLARLQKEFGPKTGETLYKNCRGQDERVISSGQARKSVSAEINYGIRFKNDGDADKFLTDLSEEVHSRLQNAKVKGKTITLKVMVRRPDAPLETSKYMGHGICNNMSKSVTLPLATDDANFISKECIILLRSMKVKASDLRGIGVQVQRLEPAEIKGQGHAKGNQSILSFAVKNQEQTPSCANNAYKDACKVTNVENSKKETLVKISSDSEENRTKSSSESIPSTVTSAKGSLMSPFTTSSNKVPQLPKLPSLSPAEPFHVPSQDYFPSPSQIDPSVLLELPGDIRQQIENELRNRKSARGISSSTIHTPRDQQESVQMSDERPGCSSWGLNSMAPGSGVERVTNSEDKIVPLPSPSQLDESCLNALPEELQNELRQAYALQTAQQSSPHKQKSVTHLRASPNVKKLVGKSPTGRKNISPKFKVPRGRGSRGRPKKLFQPRNVSKIDEVFGFKQPSSSSSGAVPSFSREKTPSPEKAVVLTDADERSVSGEATASEEGHTDVINLCGAVTIREVRTMLKEWIASTDDPQETDISTLTEYLEALTIGRNLEQVHLVIKFLLRQSSQMTNPCWSQACRVVVSEAQEIVKHVYGFGLKL